MDTTNTIRVPGHIYALLTKMRRVEREQTREMGQLPSFDEVASHMGLTEKKKTLVAEACRTRRVASSAIMARQARAGFGTKSWMPRFH